MRRGLPAAILALVGLGLATAMSVTAQRPAEGLVSRFHWVHNLVVDSKGNIFTTEVDDAKRVQKFVYQGLFPVGR